MLSDKARDQVSRIVKNVMIPTDIKEYEIPKKDKIH